ncbi:MAG: hypothetical protein ACI9MC_002552 [Kiritimatiellia bacterium]|jgi:hypothetical protein
MRLARMRTWDLQDRWGGASTKRCDMVREACYCGPVAHCEADEPMADHGARDIEVFLHRSLQRLVGLLPDAVSICLVVRGEDPGAWTLVTDGPNVSLHAGLARWPDCTVECDAGQFLLMLDGDLDLEKAFMDGRLCLEGDVGLALRLQQGLFVEREPFAAVAGV